MRKFLTAIVLVFCFLASYQAEQVRIRHIRELVQPAEIIARVKILASHETGAKEGYSRIAYAQVIDPIKGVSLGGFVLLENDKANIACPNVVYEVGEEALIFAKSLPNGNFHTVYADAGKFLVTDSTVNRLPFWINQSYGSARAQIKREMKKAEALHQKSVLMGSDELQRKSLGIGMGTIH